VIVGDLVVPWRPGEGALFTVEQFEAARAALSDGGLFCQWIPLFQVSEVEFKILVRTFLAVFPEAQVWRGDFSPTEPAVALIGGGGLSASPNVQQRLSEMMTDPANPHLNLPEAVWMYEVGTLHFGDLDGTELRVNSENRPWIELMAPLEHAGVDPARLFIGRKLQAWLESVRAKTPRGEAGQRGTARVAASEAGDMFAGMLLDLEEGQQERAAAAQMRLKRILPAELYRVFFGAANE